MNPINVLDLTSTSYQKNLKLLSTSSRVETPFIKVTIGNIPLEHIIKYQLLKVMVMVHMF